MSARASTEAREARGPDARQVEVTPEPVPEAPARKAASTPAPAVPSGDEALRATPQAPVFVVTPPAGTFPLARQRRPASSQGAERPAPPDVDVPTPAAGDDETPRFMRALAARAVTRQLELARAAGVPEAELEALLADYDPDGSLGASLLIATSLQTARLEALDTDATGTEPVEGAHGTVPPPDER